MSGDPRRYLRPLRALVLALSAAGVLYLVLRFDSVRLPDEACSPLWEVRPGALLVVDLRPPRVAPGDVVFFRDEAGDLRLARVAADGDAEPSELRLEVDPTGCTWPPGGAVGPLERERLLGRLVVALPW